MTRPASLDLVRHGLLPLLLGGLLLAGCGGGQGAEPDVPAGQCTAYVEGAVSDTLRGEARARRREGALVGLELGEKEAAGLSIELEPRSPALRSYDVIDPELFDVERSDAPPAVVAFLRLDKADFEATEGTLELTYVGDEQVGATFRFQMDGAFREGGSDDVSVEVSGEINASAGP